MNLDKMVNEALAQLDTISIDEFEQDFIEAGYTPTRKSTVAMTDSLIMKKTELCGQITYRKSTGLKGTCSEEYGSNENKNIFPLAA